MNFNKKFSRSLLVFASLLFLFTPFFQSSAETTSTGSLTVQMTVPQEPPGLGGCPGCQPGGGGNTPPTVALLSVTVDVTSSTILWTASDDVGISEVTLVYGLDINYGSNGVVENPSGATYRSQLLGLAPNTTYFFKITAKDTTNQTTPLTGSFTTAVAADTVAPTISNINVAAQETSATISWDTNENSVGQIKYGRTNNYGSITPLENNAALNHSQTITGLLPNTTYHFQILATDAAGNTRVTSDATFKTNPDAVAPLNVSNLSLTTTSQSIILTWNNPASPDWSGVKIVRKVGLQPSQSINDGTPVYTGAGSTFTDQTVVANITYTYTVFAFDTSFNYSQGAFASGKILSPPVAEICANGADDDGNGKIDCADNACAASQQCKEPPRTENNCANNIDDDGDGLIDCADNECSQNQVCRVVTPEVCDNRLDDDGNGRVDCGDLACAGFGACSVTVTSTYQQPDSTVPTGVKINADKIEYYVGNRKIRLRPAQGTITSLAGASFTVAIDSALLYKKPLSVIAKLDGGNNYRFEYQNATGYYYSDFSFPQVGKRTLYLEIDYGGGQFDATSVALYALAHGVVYSGDQAIAGAEVTLSGEGGALVDTVSFGSENPQLTTVNGTYGWVVLNGNYSLTITKEGYYDRNLPAFSIRNNVVNVSAELILKPPKILEDVRPTSTLTDNTKTVAKNIASNVRAVTQKTVQKVTDIYSAIDTLADQENVQSAASNIVVPAVVGVTAFGTAALISWLDILPFLRLLFLQPLMLLGLRKKEGWGQVYNSLSKLPVDLATLRLIDAATGRVLQTKVTDKQGRYAFVASPGVYKIEAIKNSFVFPSALLHGFKDDGRRVDVYHGEEIKVNEKDAVITANIPLDPIGETKKPIRIFWQQLGRRAQSLLSWLGLAVTLVSLYIAPRWYVWVLLCVHLFLLAVFRRLALPPKVKSWGIVYDATTKNPVGRAVARLFNSQFNKLVSTQITDNKGRYYFLAGDDKYYVTYEHPDYDPHKTDVLDLTGKDAENITLDIHLEKNRPESAPSPDDAPAVPLTPPPQETDKNNT